MIQGRPSPWTPYRKVSSSRAKYMIHLSFFSFGHEHVALSPVDLRDEPSHPIAHFSARVDE